MQGSVLILDAIATNRIVLKVKLQGAFYRVSQASTLEEALTRIERERPDLVISALDLPDGDAAELCAHLLRKGGMDHLPVLGVGTPDSAEARLRLLQAGVRDILARPIDDQLLLGRVRGLIRARLSLAEFEVRDDASHALGLAEPEGAFAPRGHCMLMCADRARLQGYATQLRPSLGMKTSLSGTGEVMRQIEPGAVPDLFILILPREMEDPSETLRTISALRANALTRHAGILVVQELGDSALSANLLDIGADDLMAQGFEPQELCLRARALLRRSRIAERLRSKVRTGLQAALYDPLTGLHNRRYAMPHLARTAENARKSGRSFAVLAADLDHFKRVNDRYGHAAGDAVLVEVARRIRAMLRPCDLIARIGGEEFMIVLPATTEVRARAAALRICRMIAAKPFEIPDSDLPIDVTISIGMAFSMAPETSLQLSSGWGEKMLARADRALYAAKGGGRNQVNQGRPAA